MADCPVLAECRPSRFSNDRQLSFLYQTAARLLVFGEPAKLFSNFILRVLFSFSNFILWFQSLFSRNNQRKKKPRTALNAV
jgi:hypothetical protein